MISVRDVRIGYNSRVLAEGISFYLSCGEVCVLLGANGSGKTTLLRTVSGLVKPLGGVVQIGDRNIHRLRTDERSKLISIVSTERPQLDQMTVYELVALGRAPYTNTLGLLRENDLTRIQNSMRAVNIHHLANHHYQQLSDGEKQLAQIARALAQDTPVIVLDEPTAFLDYRNKREVLNHLRALAHEHKKSVLFSTHDVELSIEIADKILLMRDKQITFTHKNNETLAYVTQALLN
ncbi:MAG: ABC transporter ATP-binding protein [Chitinophagales bacterium]|nr:ABC transporter ATP-binding protein [Chitinophagales bacterium]MDW8419511.1 ABC transporter ATP-binding protein [Chitinophagales bacterium]